MVDLVKELLVSMGVPQEYHAYAIAAALLLFAFGGWLVYFVRTRWNYHWRMVDSEDIDVQVHDIFQDEAGQWYLRFESVGIIDIRQIGGLQAEMLNAAANATTKESVLITLASEKDQHRLLNRIVKLAGTLPSLVLRSIHNNVPRWKGALFCEKFLNIPTEKKLFLLEDHHPNLLRTKSVVDSIKKDGLEFPHHIDRLTSLLTMVNAIDGGGKVAVNGGREQVTVIREYRGLRQREAKKAVPVKMSA